MKTCYVVSLKYAPGSAKEFRLLGDNLRKRDWRVIYLLSSRYAWLMDPRRDDVFFLTDSSSVQTMVLDTLSLSRAISRDLRRLFQRFPPDFLCTYNRHPLEFIVTGLARSIYPSGIRAVFLHEPFVPNKLSYGILHAAYIEAAERLSALTLRHSSCVIVPSAYAKSLFALRYPNYAGNVYLAPLLLPKSPTGKSSPRRYISFIGNINQARNLGDFLKLIDYATKEKEALEFCIVTRFPISRYIRSLPAEARDKVTIVSKPMISDEEITRFVRASIGIFLPHRQAAQSGNIPVAFREGTPVIARDVPGLSQHVRHMVNGYIFPRDATERQLLDAVRFVCDNFRRLSLHAREDFEDIFAESNWTRHYGWLLEESLHDVSVGSILPTADRR